MSRPTCSATLSAAPCAPSPRAAPPPSAAIAPSARRAGAERLTYNSCRNRHCPKCQRVATERWLTARRRELLCIPAIMIAQSGGS